MTTLAPLTTAPVGSVIVPPMLPEPTVLWAQLETTNINTSNPTAIETCDRYRLLLPFVSRTPYRFDIFFLLQVSDDSSRLCLQSGRSATTGASQCPLAQARCE